MNSDSLTQRTIVVLLVDDQAMIGEAVRRMLANEDDIIYHFCSEPSQALPKAMEVAPTVILQDLVMPEVDGLMLVKFFRSHPITRDIPLIVLSSKEEAQMKADAFAIGANDYLVKLPDKVELIARIRYHSHAYINLLQRDEAYQAMQDYLKKLELERRKVEQRTRELSRANSAISSLNEQLRAENLRLGTELSVARQLQRMILPRPEDLKQIADLDIAAYMSPADEVGGDYYDVVQHDGKVFIGIGDVTGHGLMSGVLMLMVQTAVQTLLLTGEPLPSQFLSALNQTFYNSLQRIESERNMTLVLLEYENGYLRITGQHETVLVLRASGKIEEISTDELGFPIGLEENIAAFIGEAEVFLEPGDGIVLYTDGIPESMNEAKKMYGMERLRAILEQTYEQQASEICEAAIEDVLSFIGQQKIYDDITLLVFKRMEKTFD